MVMPADIGELVEEMRSVWRRLPKSRLAFAYVRSFPVERDLLKFNSGTKQDFIPIRKFPGKLRTVIRSARKHTPRFYPISQTQYNQIRAFRSDPSHFYVIENERPYWLVVFLSRNSSQSSSLKGINPHEPSTKSSHKALPHKLSTLLIFVVMMIAVKTARAGDGTFSTTLFLDHSETAASCRHDTRPASHHFLMN